MTQAQIKRALQAVAYLKKANQCLAGLEYSLEKKGEILPNNLKSIQEQIEEICEGEKGLRELIEDEQMHAEMAKERA